MFMSGICGHLSPYIEPVIVIPYSEETVARNVKEPPVVLNRPVTVVTM